MAGTRLYDWVDSLRLTKSSVYFSGSTVYELLYGLGLREMEYFLIWCTWIRQGLVSIETG